MFQVVFFFFLLCLAVGAGIVYLALKEPERWQSFRAFMQRIGQSFAMRLGVTGLLTLLLLIPLMMIDGLIAERARYREQAVSSVERNWGLEQVVGGPYLVVPYVNISQREESYVDDTGTKRLRTVTDRRTRQVTFLPKDLEIMGNLAPEVRKRGIYKSNVYTGSFDVGAQFEALMMDDLSPEATEVLWDQSHLVVHVSDPRGIGANIRLAVNGDALTLKSGAFGDLFEKGFSAQLTEAQVQGLAAGQGDVALTFDLRGSNSLRFLPLGEQSRVDLTSVWPSPSFFGAKLPETREISSEGFVAQWQIPHLARTYGQRLTTITEHMQREVTSSASGVRLVEPVWLYLKAERAVKYGFLFIGLSFLILLMIEYSLKVRLHLVQYGVIGGALVLVYLLLLSLAEHIGFGFAFAVATATIVGLVAGYAHLSVGRWVLTGWLAAALTGLFSVMYTLLSLEDYALLVGTFLLLAALVAVMIVTRKLAGPSVRVADTIGGERSLPETEQV